MRSIIVFCLMGGLNTIVHVCVGLLMYYTAGLSAFNANLVAFCAGFTVSYFLHRNVTFRSPAAISHSMPRFFVISLISLVLNQVIVYTVVDVIGQSYLLALLVMICLVPTFTYIASRLWAFSDGDF